VGRVVVRGSELQQLVEKAGGIGDWVQRSKTALEQRDDLVQNVWSSTRRRPLSPDDLSSDGSTKWTEEGLSGLVADMVELIIETSNPRDRL
jgi:hypothetical protein